MSLFTERTFRRALLAVALLLSCHAIAAPADPQRVLVVKSSDNAYFTQTIETLHKHAGESVEIDSILVENLESPEPVALIIALGYRAAVRVASLAGETPVINAYLTVEQYRQLGERRHPTVLLDQPLARYLAFSKFALQADSIGILTQDPIPLDHDVLELLEDLAFEARQYSVGPGSKLLPTLRELLEANDALLMLPRKSLYNHDSLKGVLMTSYRSRKPVISYSPAHVKSGALASIYSSPVDIGRHLSILMHESLNNAGVGPARPHFARFYTIALNSSVAGALGLTLPSEVQLRQRVDQLAR